MANKRTTGQRFRIGLISYPIRLISNLFGTYIIYHFETQHDEFSPISYGLLIATLVVPHLGYITYRLSSNKRRAVLLFYYLDAVMTGIFIAIIQLTYVVSIVIFITIITSSLALSGPRFTAKNILLVVFSFLITFYLEGYAVNFETTPLFSGLAGIYLCIHLTVFAAASYYFMNNIAIVKNRISSQNEVILEQNNNILKQHQEIRERLTYARDIQEIMLPGMELFQRYFKDFFIFYQPKETVSGDFFWLRHKGDFVFLACVDCTGHGVPGAFMSMISYQLLDEIVLDQGMTEPLAIFEELHGQLNMKLRQESTQNNDGIAISLIRFDRSNRQLVYGGSYQPMLVLSDGKLQQFKGARKPIGGVIFNKKRSYTTHEMVLPEDSTIYLFSDGIYDQFREADQEKLGLARLKEHLLEAGKDSFKSQNISILNLIEDWKGRMPQTDDITFIGVKL